MKPRVSIVKPRVGTQSGQAPAGFLRRASGNRFLRFGTLAVAVALDLVLFRPTGGPAVAGGDFLTFARGDFAAAIALQERHNPDLLGIPGVAGTAVAIGPNGLPVVKVFLARAGVIGLPASLDGHSLVTEVTGAFHALGDMPAGDMQAPGGVGDDAGGPSAVPAAANAGTDPRKSFPRPVPIGVSTGQVDVTAGTIAARVVSGSDVFALSNNHVYANKNAAKLGDHILQPGKVDGGVNPTDAIGTLHDFEPIKFCAPFPTCPANRIDAAIAATTTENLGNSTPSNGYGTPRNETMAARLGMEVQKYGRTTGHTTGKISGINAIMNVGFRDGTARFTGQIMITKSGFSGPGDSGSLIVSGGSGDDGRRPVALLFAGSETSTIANPIDLVLKRFNVTIDGN